MKKKFINGLLLVALFVGFTSSMVSCKDYDDEKIGDLQGIVADNDATLRQLLAAQKVELENQIKALTTSLEQCQTNCKTVQDELKNKFADYLTITAFNTFQDELGNKYWTSEEVKQNVYTKAEINQLFEKYYTQEEVNAKLEAIKADLDKKASIETIISLLGAGKNDLTDALESYFLNNATILEVIKNNGGMNEEQVNAIVVKAISDVNSRIDLAAKQGEQALKLAQANKTSIDSLGNVVSGLNTVITTLGQTVDGLKNSVVDLDSRVTTAQTTANDAKALAEKNSQLIAALTANYNSVSELVSNLNDSVNLMKGDITTLQNLSKEFAADIKDLKEKIYNDSINAAKLYSELQETVNGLVESINTNAKTIGELRSDFTAYQAEVKAKFEELQAKLDAALAANTSNGAAVDNLLSFLKNVMAKFISGIEINGTNNPLFGQLNTPFDVRTNVLVAFHGTLGTRGLQFPTDNDAFYALPASHQWETITETDIEMMFGEGGSLEDAPGYINVDYDKDIIAKDGAVGNAGSLYLTVNPTDRDFTGTSFTLINSRNEESPMKLANLAKTDQLLTFGYTRAAGPETQSANGFYEAKATLTAEDALKVRVDLNFSGLKTVAKDFQNYRNGINITNTVTNIYDAFSNVLPAQAVKATWSDSTGTKSVVSQYAIAATAVRPLSFAFAKDIHYDRVPGLGRLENFVDNMLAKIDFALPEMKDINFDINSITFDELSEDLLAKFRINISLDTILFKGGFTKTVSLPDYFYVDEVTGDTILVQPKNKDLTVTIDEQNLTITVEYDLSGELSTVYDNLTGPVENIKSQIADFLDDINDYLAKLNDINLDKVKDNISETISHYVEEINERFAKYMNPNKYLQPLMLVKANGSYARLSESSNYSARVYGTDVLLAPTTYNAEILSPAYKKFIAITNVSKKGASAKAGDKTCRNILEQANKQDRMKQVIDGGFDDFIKFTAVKGYTYEVLYTAVDYSGLVVTKKFYFSVAE